MSAKLIKNNRCETHPLLIPSKDLANEAAIAQFHNVPKLCQKSQA